MRARKVSRFAQDQAGAAAVEFALVCIPLLTLIFGIGAIGLMLYTNAALHWAVEKSARTAGMSNTVTQGQISTEINNYLGSFGFSNANVTFSVAAGALPIAHITATLSKTYAIPFMAPIRMNFSADTYVPQPSL
jgi:Flp pilus assembly protein TadG